MNILNSQGRLKPLTLMIKDLSEAFPLEEISDFQTL